MIVFAKSVLCLFLLAVVVDYTAPELVANRGPRLRLTPRQAKADTLMLPSNATSIRENITDGFSCENRTYGYYADVDNECQIFHVCLPVMFANGKSQTFRWSFICPEETIFNQEIFVCVREEDSTVSCEESENYYSLNDNFGDKEFEDIPDQETDQDHDDNKVEMQEDSKPEEDAKNTPESRQFDQDTVESQLDKTNSVDLSADNGIKAEEDPQRRRKTSSSSNSRRRMNK